MRLLILSLLRLRMRVRLLVMNFGWANCIVVSMVLLALICYFLVVPHAELGLLKEHQSLAKVRDIPLVAASSAILPVPNDGNIALFHKVLGDGGRLEEHLEVLFAIAEKLNLTLQQADYKLNYDANGKFLTYHIRLPLKGSFASIQQFSEQLLLAVPYVSLDQITLKRDVIGNSVVEAQLSLSLFLAMPPAVEAHLEDGTRR